MTEWGWGTVGLGQAGLGPGPLSLSPLCRKRSLVLPGFGGICHTAAERCAVVDRVEVGEFGGGEA